jgi:hypothetical protein
MKSNNAELQIDGMMLQNIQSSKEQTLNSVQYTIIRNLLQMKLKGNSRRHCMKAKADYPDQVQSDWMVLGAVRRGSWTA